MGDFDNLLAALDELIFIAKRFDSAKLEAQLIEARAGAQKHMTIKKLLIEQNCALPIPAPSQTDPSRVAGSIIGFKYEQTKPHFVWNYPEENVAAG